MDPEKRVFSDQEVADIMRRATELQEHSKDEAAKYKLGVTRDELERAAAEVGVSSEFLKQAIQEKLAGSQPKRGFAIAPTEERVVEGEIDPNDFDILLEHIRTFSSRRHPVTQVGHLLTARARTGSGIANVEVHSRNGRTRIRVKPMPIFEAIGTFYPAFIVSMMAGAPLAEAGHPLVSAAIASGAFIAAVFGFLGWTKKSRKNAAKLADRLEGAIAEEIDTANRKRLQYLTAPNERQATKVSSSEQA